MKLLLYFLSAALYLVPGFTYELCAQPNHLYTELKAGFVNPPAQARPAVYHWWLGGHVDTVRLKAELVSLKSAGVSGMTFFEIGSRDTGFVKQGPPFLGDQSLAIIKFAVEEAGRLGLTVGLNTASSWNAGGTWITPEHAAKSIYFSKQSLTSRPDAQRLLFPEIPVNDPWGKPRLIEFREDGKPVFYRDIAVLAIPASIQSPIDTSQILNVSQFFDPGSEMLHWQAPPGNWDIYRYVCSNSGENLVLPSQHSAGPIVDHYDASATEFHFNYIIDKLTSVLGDLRKTALRNLYMASYEAKGFTWTTTLPDRFREINGYEVYKLLPGLFDADKFTPAIRASFKADFQRTLSELMIDNFYKKSREICNQHGLNNNSEAGGPGLPLHNVPVEPLKALGSIDIPRGEFWIHHNRWNEKGIDILRVVKEVSAASHIYDRGIVEMEAFTSFQHWREGPFEMKPYGDRAFCEGMNKVVVHGSTHNPHGTGYPGIVYHAGTHYNDKRVWWPKIRPFNDYLGRVSHILQGTDFVADVAYYYGDTIPNYGGHKNSRFTVGPGYDYEIINTEILNEITVKNGKIILPRTGATFSMLALADEQWIDPEVLGKLADLVKQGAVVVGDKPNGVAKRRTGFAQPGTDGLLDRLWVSITDGQFPAKRGKIYEGITPAAALASLGVGPDFNYPGMEYAPLDYIHYSRDGLDFYFIRNTTDDWVSRNCSFRQDDKVPEFWDPVRGETFLAPIYKQREGYVDLPLSLAPYGSTFVVFKRGKAMARYSEISGSVHPPVLEYNADGFFVFEEGNFALHSRGEHVLLRNTIHAKTLDGAWEVFFPEGWGAPAKAIFPHLISWSESQDEGIKYFSGIATYRKTFQHDINSPRGKIYLELGEMSHVAEAWLNDEPLGIAWTRPFRFDVTPFIKPGDNTLVVEVANTWSNRLVGDAITGSKFTRTNIPSTTIHGLNNTRVQWKDVPLIRSGLLGPVRIITLTGN